LKPWSDDVSAMQYQNGGLPISRESSGAMLR
jgi:hypothetical protein